VATWWVVGLRPSGAVSLWARGQWPDGSAYGGGVGVAACLFFQCFVVWRIFPWARGSGCQSFSSPLCFASATHVSSVSARSLIHGAHAVCVCALAAILKLNLEGFQHKEMADI
jgi:hypothetical protein